VSVSTAEPAVAVRVRPKRSIVVWVVLVLAGAFLLASCFAVWVNRVALNTDVLVGTSAELIEDDQIRQAVATRAVDELFASVDIEVELRQRLPQDFKGLSGPAGAGFREGAYTVVDRALERPRLQQLWALALEQAHRTLVEVLEGEGQRVATEGGVVTLDLRLIILEAADRIGLREQAAENLPADVGDIEILRSDELDTAQDAFQLLKATAWVLPVVTLLLFGLAVWLAGDRRRAVRRVGITVAAVGLVGLVAVNVVGNYVVESLVVETQGRTAGLNAWDILTRLLRNSFRWLLAIGILFLVAAWLAGPGPRAVGARRFLAPFARQRVWAYAGLGVVALALLLGGEVDDATRFLAVLCVVALGAVWIEQLRRQTMRQFPDASAPALVDEMRTRLGRWWEENRGRVPARVSASPEAPATSPPAAHAPPAAAPGASDLSAALVSLADLHARGALTDEEFAAAKARILGG
jgi:Short C-terminal domain